MDMLVYHISLDKYTSNKQIREWLEVDRNTASKVIAALRKAGSQRFLLMITITMITTLKYSDEWKQEMSV